MLKYGIANVFIIPFTFSLILKYIYYPKWTLISFDQATICKNCIKFIN